MGSYLGRSKAEPVANSGTVDLENFTGVEKVHAVPEISKINHITIDSDKKLTSGFISENNALKSLIILSQMTESDDLTFDIYNKLCGEYKFPRLSKNRYYELTLQNKPRLDKEYAILELVMNTHVFLSYASEDTATERKKLWDMMCLQKVYTEDEDLLTRWSN